MRRSSVFLRLRRPCVLVTCLLGIGLLLGCRSTTGPLPLYPIDQTDIAAIQRGTVCTRPDGSVFTAPEDGAYMSKFYMDQVAKVKIDWLARQKK
jgi:hypothetical protein